MTGYDRYNRALSVALYILEGNTLKSAKKEFNLCERTLQRDLKFLYMYGYGEVLKRNRIIYIRVKNQLKKNSAGG